MGYRWDPIPVTATPLGDSAFGISQLVGNGWEWTSTVFQPFPGFQPFPFYPGYSARFFDGDHYVLKGASSRTDEVLLAPIVSQLVPAQLPLCLCRISLCGGLI